MDKEKDLVSIALWAARRLSNKYQREYTYEELLKTIGENHEYSKFIQDCLKECEK